MKKLKKLKKLKLSQLNQSGQLFLLAVIILGLVMVNTLLIMSGSISFNQNSRYTLTSEQAENLAEAGIDKAVATFNRIADSYNGESETPLGDGTYEVKITSNSSTTKVIESTGYVPNKANAKSRRTIKIQVSKGSGVSFNYGVQVGEGGLVMSNNTQVNGSMYSNGNVYMENNSIITGDVTVAGGSQPTSNQETDCQGSNCTDLIFGRTINGENRLDVAQSFTTSQTAVINKVSIKVKKFGSPSNLTLRIVGDSSNKPNRSDVLAQGTLNANLVTTSYGFIDVALTSNPTLYTNQKYWILLDTSSNNTNYWSWSADSAQSYPDNRGFALWTSDWTNRNSVWNDPHFDLGFKIYMGGIATYIQGSSNSEVQGNARANTLLGLNVGQGAYYQVAQNVTAQSYHPNTNDPPVQAMPISDANMAKWKELAADNGVITGDITTCPTTLYSRKYIGSINLPGGCTVNVETPIWVTGGMNLGGNNTIIRLPAAYQGASGALIVDGQITLNNNNQLRGSGETGSYLVLISEFNSRDDPQERYAIDVQNNGNTGIVYSNLGSIRISNNNHLTEVTGWKLLLDNNVTVTYDQGLANAFFSSGPSGSYSVIKGTYQIE